MDFKAFCDSGIRAHQQVGEPEDLYIQSKRRKGQPAAKARGVVIRAETESSSDSDDSDELSDVDDFNDSGDDFDDDADTNQAAGKGKRRKKGGTEIQETTDFEPIKATKDDADNHSSKRTLSDTGTLDDLARDAQQVLHLSREDFNLLFPAAVPAFGLKSKDWGWVLVDGLRDIVWNSTAFQSLQYDQGTKDLVHALIRGHKRGLKTGFDDLIAGKGQGLVFLLHG